MKIALQTRYSAYLILSQVLFEKKTTDMAFSREKVLETLPQSDHHFARLLVLTVLRRFYQAQSLLKPFLSKPLPPKLKKIELILIMGVVQLYFLKIPPHAVVDTSVELTKIIKQASFSKLVNAVLHAFVRSQEALKEPNCEMILPQWLFKKWVHQFGHEKTKAFCESFLKEPFLDITVKKDPKLWAQKLNATLLDTGSLRCLNSQNVTLLEGFETGDWWVQEASASLPVQLFHDLKNKRGADLCSAPGGKTAQLISKGAFVEAFDVSQKRLDRLKQNMKRLNFENFVETKCQNALDISGEEIYDFILLDAPCSATGTIRKHPDLLFHLTQEDVTRLAQIQKELLIKAIRLLKKGGELVYSTCSLNEEENESVVESVLKECPFVSREVIDNKSLHQFLTPKGALEVTPDRDQDGFYAVLLKKQ